MKITEKQIAAVAVNASHLTGANVSNNIKKALKAAFDRDLITDDIGRVAEIFKKDGYEVNKYEFEMGRVHVTHYPGGRKDSRQIAFPYFIGEAQEYGFDSGVFNEYSAISSCHSCKEVIEFI